MINYGISVRNNVGREIMNSSTIGWNILYNNLVTASSISIPLNIDGMTQFQVIISHANGDPNSQETILPTGYVSGGTLYLSGGNTPAVVIVIGR